MVLTKKNNYNFQYMFLTKNDLINENILSFDSNRFKTTWVILHEKIININKKNYLYNIGILHCFP